jgi:hypothetical protein
MRLEVTGISCLVAVASVTALGLVAACGDDATPEGWSESCQRIIEACYYKDPGIESPVNDCHTIGHTGEAVACEEAIREGECLEICESAPVPTFSEAGTDAFAPDAADALEDAAASDSPGAEAASVDAPVPSEAGADRASSGTEGS